MRNYRLIYLIMMICMMVVITSCGVTPCDCAHAQLRNDTKTLKKCDEKVSTLSREESIEWYKEESQWIETQ
jgi:hypothetical protein